MRIPLSFVAGVMCSVAFFAYTLIYRYRGLEPKFDETRPDRIRRVCGNIAWERVTVLMLAAGFTGFVLWNGLDDTLQLLTDTI